jgi:hypothetical protein
MYVKSSLFYCGEFLPKCNMERGHVITQLSFSSKNKWISLVCDENCKREGGHLMDGMDHLWLGLISQI